MPVVEIPKAYANRPPVIRDRAPSTLELADDDFIEDSQARGQHRAPPRPVAKPPAPKMRIPPTGPVFVVPEPITPPPRAEATSRGVLAFPDSETLPVATRAPTPAVPPPRMPPTRDASPPEAVVPVASSPRQDDGAIAADKRETLSPPESGIALRTAPLPDLVPAAGGGAPRGPGNASPVPSRKRASTLDPMDALFDGVYEMNFVDTAVEAADVCAGALAAALRARAVLIHVHDAVRREVKTVGVVGGSYSELFGVTAAIEDDLVASAVLGNEGPVTMRFDGELPRSAPARLRLVGARRTLVAVPAMAWGRCVAIIEVVDADERISHRVADSVSYVAARFAEFISDRAAA